MSHAYTPRFDWAAAGFRLELEKVAKRAGTNGSDKVELNRPALMPIPVDLPKVIESVGAEGILGSLDGTSLRVKFQGVNREHPTESLAEIEVRLWNVVKGIRAAKAPSVPKHSLPGGGFYQGTDLDAYRTAYIRCLVEHDETGNMTPEIAQMVAMTLKF